MLPMAKDLQRYSGAQELTFGQSAWPACPLENSCKNIPKWPSNAIPLNQALGLSPPDFLEETPSRQSSGSVFPRPSPKAVSSYLPERKPRFPQRLPAGPQNRARLECSVWGPRNHAIATARNPSRVKRFRHKQPTPHLQWVPSIYSGSPRSARP